jgi:hypothetical protein
VSAVERGRIRGGVGRRLHSVVIDVGQMDPADAGSSEVARADGDGSVVTSSATRAPAPRITRSVAASPALPPSDEGFAVARQGWSGDALARKSSAHWATQAPGSSAVPALRLAPVAAFAPEPHLVHSGPSIAASGSSLTTTRVAVAPTASTKPEGTGLAGGSRGWVLRSVDSVAGPALSSPPLAMTAAELQAELSGGRGASVPRQRLARRGSSLAVAAAATMFARGGGGGPARGESASPAPGGGLARRQTGAPSEMRAAGRR